MGPDVAAAVRAAGVPAVVTNETYRLAPWADILVANDAAWWNVRAQEALKFPGIKVCLQDCPYPAVKMLTETGRAADRAGFDPTPGCVRSGGNSGHTGAHIVAQGGASRILLCGFDMRPGRWHGEHERPLRNTSLVTFEHWKRRFAELYKALEARGVEVLNCTPGSALRCVPFVDLKDALAACVEPAA